MPDIVVLVVLLAVITIGVAWPVMKWRRKRRARQIFASRGRRKRQW